jgi:hypothetical protein
MAAMRAAGALALLTSAHSNLYDVIQPHLIPPEGGCVEWASLPDQDKHWFGGKPPADAGAHCAQQGKGNPGGANWDPDMGSGSDAHYISSYCMSKVNRTLTRCTSGMGIPEQVNVQIASGDSVVIGFVTFEEHAPTDPPTATANGKVHTGVTHVHHACTVGVRCTGDGWDKNTSTTTHPFALRTYYMHYVKLSALAPKSVVTYTVKSGGAGAVASDTFKFRAPYADGATKIALYGDMGVYSWNNMQNLWEETVQNETADLIIHAGDHCYNEGDDDEHRADAYMQAFEKTIANVPWMPIVGNHEFYAGTNLSRYLDQTWQKWGPLAGGAEWSAAGDEEAGLSGATSATSALGAFLSAGNHHGPGVHAKVPSKTSRYFSVDFGLTHLVALSLNGYNGVDDCTTECNAAQLEWLKKDLAAVDRSKTPWVMAMSHYPMYLNAMPTNSSASAAKERGTSEYAEEAWWNAEQCEYAGHARNCTGGAAWAEQQKAAAKAKALSEAAAPSASAHSATTGNANADLEPIFMEYGVDICECDNTILAARETASRFSR